jgi:hypothetical protein
MNKLIILFLCLLFNLSIWAQDSFLDPIDTLHIPLNADDIYAWADANNEFIAFYNLSTESVHIKSLLNNESKIIKLEPGRGPNEYTTISDLIINEYNIIHLVDTNGYKIIKVDVDGLFYNEINHNIKSGIGSILKNETLLYISTNIDLLLGSYYHRVSFSDENSIKLQALNPIKYDLTKINHKNFFNFVGHADVNNYHLVHAHTYSPKFTIYPFNTNTAPIVVDYDEYEEMEDNRYINRESTEALSLPPSKVDVLLEHMFLHPSNDKKVYINAKGSTKKKGYRSNEIYEFDLKEQRFTGTYDLGFTPASIARYNDVLYILPEFDENVTLNSIFVYRIN